ncbi:unnamed protein product [Linum tenue]|uniref:Uncharacterized protein n=1 Tax=Linum tenue TaxID=586396 RepID=A0AAV0MD46_9ROSI|nr:unnamed protein product [Linum tenue]
MILEKLILPSWSMKGCNFFRVMADVLFQSNQRNKEPIPPQIQQIVNVTLKLNVKLTRFNFLNHEAKYFVVSIDHDPLQARVDAFKLHITSVCLNCTRLLS